MVFGGQDAWRRHPMLTKCANRPFPMLGTAVVIFGGYMIIDYVANKALAEEQYFKPIKFKEGSPGEGPERATPSHAADHH